MEDTQEQNEVDYVEYKYDPMSTSTLKDDATQTDKLIVLNQNSSEEVLPTKIFGESNRSDLYFFKSLLSDMDKLSAKRKRKFKEDVLKSLNTRLNEQEDELLL